MQDIRRAPYGPSLMDANAPAPWLEHLNGEQRTAACESAPALLILAGAGTGKTTTLTARVADLLARGVQAERILLLTFTRRAARELVERARASAERAGWAGGRILGGTFHSIAHRMARAHRAALGLPEGFGVLDAGDAADLLAMIREELGHAGEGRRFPRAPTLLDIYSRTVNSQLALDDVLASSFPWCEGHREALALIFREYGARKRRMGVIDLDDLLLGWRALARDEVIGRAMAASFDHVLVDEYQDVNGLQVDVVAALHGAGCALTAVGDDMQAIYGFRAASARYILEFPSAFPGAVVRRLERNYRSTAPILAVANAVAAQDAAAHAKTLWTDRDGGSPVELVEPRDEVAQAHAVCERVLESREQGMELKEQAVLFRTGHDADLLELELARRDIPFVKYGGLRYLDAAHVKDLVAALRVACNPADEVSWFRLLQLLEGVGPVRARRVLEALRPEPGGAPDAALAPAALAQLPAAARTHGAAILAALAATRPDEEPAAATERLVAAVAPAVALRYPDGAVRVGDLDQLVGGARGARTIAEFVTELVLDAPSSSAAFAVPPHLDEDFLVLSTVHSAKGLEWEAVHIICAYDGNFPADMNADDDGVDEERRLFYVALTRARRRLHVYVPARFYHRARGVDDAHGLGQASRFLAPDVVALMARTRPSEADPPAPVPAMGDRRVAISADELFV